MLNQALQLNKSNNTYVSKKTEKLVSAIYLISNFLSDKEPLKWQLREAGLDLVQKGLSVNSKILSLLEIAYVGGLISEMNFNILKFEFENLFKLVGSGDNTQSLILSEQFFNVPESQTVLPANISKGQNSLSDRFVRELNTMSVKNSDLKLKDKSNRQDLILGLLKKGGVLGIKDFTLAIKDCSEKTIQRELVTLVYKGQIKKEGEKRWSRYSLK